MNDFLISNMKQNEAFTANGAKSYATIGSELLDQFGKAGMARGRDYDTVWGEQDALWRENPQMALRFPFYLRMITRKVKTDKGVTEKIQRGQGAKDEAFKRLLWIACYHPAEFEANIHMLPFIGSWKDVFILLEMSISNSTPKPVNISIEKFFEIIAAGLLLDNSRDLVAKYLPRIQSWSKCTTQRAKIMNSIAKDLAKYLNLSPKEYRSLKSSGKAHEFQKLISTQKYSELKWEAISSKALLLLTTGKFLENQNLIDCYANWVMDETDVKFNGYAYELLVKLRKELKSLESSTMCRVRTKKRKVRQADGSVKIVKGKKARVVNPKLINARITTIDKMFDNLIATASENGKGTIRENVLCALDTSGSMACEVMEGVSAFDVCVSLGLYFSKLNTGAFKDTVAMFDNTSRLLKVSGSFHERYEQIMSETTAWGGTNFQSLIDLIVNTRIKHPEIPIEDYPTTLLVVSDMQFNPSGCNYMASKEAEQTNYEAAICKLAKVFPESFTNQFKIVWWYCSGYETADYPSTMENPGTYMFSGFDPAIISILLGNEAQEASVKVRPSMEEVVSNALSQEVLMRIS